MFAARCNAVRAVAILAVAILTVAILTVAAGCDTWHGVDRTVTSTAPPPPLVAIRSAILDAPGVATCEVRVVPAERAAVSGGVVEPAYNQYAYLGDADDVGHGGGVLEIRGAGGGAWTWRLYALSVTTPTPAALRQNMALMDAVYATLRRQFTGVLPPPQAVHEAFVGVSRP